MRKRTNWTSYVMVVFVLLLIAFVLVMWIYDFSFDLFPKPSIKSGKTTGQSVKIGLAMNSLLEDRWQKERDVFVSTAQALGAEVVVQSALNDSRRQINQVKYLISKGINVLVIIPQNNPDLKQVIQEAIQDGIKVICYDSVIRNVDINLYIGFDNENVGRLMAQGILKGGAGKYLILNGSRGDYVAEQVNLGIMEVFKGKGSDSTLYEEWVQDLEPSLAVRFVSNSLIEYGDLSGIIAPNDVCAGEIIKFLSDKQEFKDIRVIGADCDLLATKRLLNGTQEGTIYKPFEDMARGAAEWAVNIARSKSIKTDRTVNNGAKDVPAVVYPVRYESKLGTVLDLR